MWERQTAAGRASRPNSRSSGWYDTAFVDTWSCRFEAAARFIDALAERKSAIGGAVSCSEQSTRLLHERGIKVLELNDVETIPVYVDGADECDSGKRLIRAAAAHSSP